MPVHVEVPSRCESSGGICGAVVALARLITGIWRRTLQRWACWSSRLVGRPIVSAWAAVQLLAFPAVDPPELSWTSMPYRSDNVTMTFSSILRLKFSAEGPSICAVSLLQDTYSVFLQFIVTHLSCSLAGFEQTILLFYKVLGGLLVMRLDRLSTMDRTVSAAKRYSLQLHISLCCT